MDVNRTILRPNGRKGDSLHRAKFSRRDRFVRHIGDEAESCKSRRTRSEGQVREPSPRAKPASQFQPLAARRTGERNPLDRLAHRHEFTDYLAPHSGGWGADENRKGARRPAEAMSRILGVSLDLQVAQCRRNHEIFERRRRKSFIPACPSRLCRRTWRGQLSGRRWKSMRRAPAAKARNPGTTHERQGA
jgi:hypothetical protein